MVVQAYNPIFLKAEQDCREFKVSLSPRLAWATEYKPTSTIPMAKKEKKRKEEEKDEGIQPRACPALIFHTVGKLH